MLENQKELGGNAFWFFLSNATGFDSIVIKWRQKKCAKKGWWFEVEKLTVQLRFGEWCSCISSSVFKGEKRLSSILITTN